MKSTALISALCLMAVGLSSWAQPPGTPGGAGIGTASPAGSRFAVQQGMRFERYRDADGYHLRILTRGMDPEALQVSVQGRSLVVQNSESHRVEQRNDRGSYQFSSSSSNMRRRFLLPPDADAEGMKRTVENGILLITLPYAEPPRY